MSLIIIFGGVSPNDYDSYFRGIMGIKKNHTSKVLAWRTGASQPLCEIGQKYPTFTYIYRENRKMDYFFIVTLILTQKMIS